MVAGGRKPVANEMVRWRKHGGFFDERGKVTARYTLHVAPSKTLACVRVHFFPGNNVAHFTVDEFNRLFRPAEKAKS